MWSRTRKPDGPGGHRLVNVHSLEVDRRGGIRGFKSIFKSQLRALEQG